MKKSLLILSSCLLAGTALQAQEYYPQGTCWEEEKTNLFDGTFHRIYRYAVDGDTLIDNTDYMKVYVDNEPYCALREAGESVYVYAYDIKKELLAYDFDWQAGKDIHFQTVEGEDYSLTISEILQTALADGNTYDYVGSGQDTRLYRGIGWENGIFGHALSPVAPTNGDQTRLYKFVRNGEIIYDQSSVFVRDGRRWAVRLESAGLSPEYPITISTRTDFIHGDTVADGTAYKKLYSSFRKDLSQAQLTGCLRQDGREVYFLPAGETEEIVCLDFGLSEGDTFTPKEENVWTVTSTGTMLLDDGTEHETITLTCGDREDVWVKDVGSLSNGILGLAVQMSGAIPELLCSHQWEVDIYQNEKYNTCYAAGPEFTFVKEGVRWTERSSTEAAPPQNLGSLAEDYELYHYSIKGTEELDGKTYLKVWQGEQHLLSLRRDADGTVYYRRGNSDHALYRFNWYADNYLHFDDLAGEDSEMEALETGEMTLADGKTYPYVQVRNKYPLYSYSNDDVRLIQGIGLTLGMFRHTERAELDCYCYNELIALYDGDKLIYKSPLFQEDGQPEAVGIDTVADGKPHPCISYSDGRLHLQGAEGRTFRLDMFDISGKKLLASVRLADGTTADASCLAPGTYVYRLSDADGSYTGKLMVGATSF